MAKEKRAKEQILKDLDKDLTAELRLLEKETLRRAAELLEEPVTIRSLDAKIGSKGNTYLDSVKMQFADSTEYSAKWFEGLIAKFEKEKELYTKNDIEFNWKARADFENVLLFRDSIINKYVLKFLERMFYRKLDERTRAKPNESLWKIWFGNTLTLGLVIAPRYGSFGWENDKSEIRKTNYNYWTIGHILETGFVVPEKNQIHRFTSQEDLLSFYINVLNRLSKSKYEMNIGEKYMEYLEKSTDLKNEPFLIPEFRYAGYQKIHKYRLDFTVLNPHTGKFIGFEISPSSSHMSIAKLKAKQHEANTELSQKWEKEMHKRNEYYDEFGITCKTFVDTDLLNINSCFNHISTVLSERQQAKLSLNDQLKKLNSL